MLKLLILFICTLSITNLYAQKHQILDRFAQSKYCAGCHPQQVRDWKSSLHSKSHITKNILYKKTVDFMSKKLYIDSQKLSVECAKCHNPRISLKKVNKNFILSKAFGIENRDVKKVETALNTEYLKEGINCIVCHNTNKINHSTDLFKRGFDAVEWGPNHVMVGPFDSNRTNYHQSVKREHFNEDVNRLCFVCHYGGENRYKLPVYTTGEEYESVYSSKKCVDCHMSEKRKGIIAPHIKKSGERQETREIRSHLFAGVRNSDIAKDALDLTLTQNGSNLLLTLSNKTPHKVPTGFGGRELLIEVIYQSNEKTIDKIYKSLNVTFLDKNGEITIPYLAKSIKNDLRLKPNEIRNISFNIPNEALKAKVIIWYKLINDDIKKMLDIKDPIFTKNYNIADKSINLTRKEKL